MKKICCSANYNFQIFLSTEISKRIFTHAPRKHCTWLLLWPLHGVHCHCGPVTARFVTRFNLWLRHDLWPHNASICDPARFVTKSASICDQRYTMILESNLCRGKLVFVFTLIMYTKWYNMMIYIYELWYNTYINSGARSLMLFTLILLEYHAWHIYIIYHVCVSYFMHHS